MKTVKVGDKDVDAAALLAALHNNTRAIGMGALHDIRRDMTHAEAAQILAERKEFDFGYVCGRPIKVFARDGVIDDHSRSLFDRDAGDGAFDRALSQALKSAPEARSA